jgi:hypothetical protein
LVIDLPVAIVNSTSQSDPRSRPTSAGTRIRRTFSDEATKPATRTFPMSQLDLLTTPSRKL